MSDAATHDKFVLKEKQKLQEELEKEREYQRKELELLKAEHALKLKEQALAAQQAVAGGARGELGHAVCLGGSRP